jgi:hypothetical protein
VLIDMLVLDIEGRLLDVVELELLGHYSTRLVGNDHAGAVRATEVGDAFLKR